MAILDIVKYPDPRLREPTFDVTEITDDVRELVRDLKDTMFAADGAGIAAIQVGRLERIFLIDGRVATGDEEAEPVVFINPKVVDTSPATIRSEEGCLSFPGVFVEIGRPRRAKLQAMDLDGNTFEAEGEGLFARAMMHEFDHLTVQLLIDMVGMVKKEVIRRRMKKFHAANDEALT